MKVSFKMKQTVPCGLALALVLLQFACPQTSPDSPGSPTDDTGSLPNPSDSPPDATGYDTIQASTGDLPTAITVGDLDDDGDLDLVVTNLRDGGVSVLANDGSGRFSDPVAYETGVKPKSVAVGDFDRDGALDIAVANSALFEDADGDVAVLLNTGHGGFPQAVNYGPEMSPCSITVGDWNGDDAPDVAVATLYGSGVSILMNVGDGSLAERVAYAVEGLAPRSLASGDFDNDGDLDLAVVTDGRLQVLGNVSILLNSGDGTFSAGDSYINIGDTPMSVYVADLNNDEIADLAVTGVFANGVFVLLGEGDGTFSDPVGYVVADSPVAVVAGDLDGDGDADLVTANQLSAEISVIYNRGDGTFGAHQTLAVGNGPNAVAIADLNGDDELDIVVTNQDDNTVSILLSR